MHFFGSGVKPLTLFGVFWCNFPIVYRHGILWGNSDRLVIPDEYFCVLFESGTIIRFIEITFKLVCHELQSSMKMVIVAIFAMNERGAFGTMNFINSNKHVFFLPEDTYYRIGRSPDHFSLSWRRTKWRRPNKCGTQS